MLRKRKAKRIAKKTDKQQIFIKDKLYKELSKSSYNHFKDSIFKNTKDTLTRKDKNTVILSPVYKIDLQENWTLPFMYLQIQKVT